MSQESAPASPDEISTPEQAALWLWGAGLRDICARKSESPYMETSTLELSGRDSVDNEFIDNALTRPWLDSIDERMDANWDYIADGREGAFKDIFEQASSGSGSMARGWEATMERMEEADSDFDRDDFEDQAREAAFELARDDGVDIFFDMQYRIGGSRQGSQSLTFQAERTAFECGALIPAFNEAGSCKDWAELLGLFKIHPVDFVDAVRELASKSGAGSHGQATLDFEPADQAAPSDAADAIEELAKQGMDKPAGDDPSHWTGGMAELAKAWCQDGASLPERGESRIDLQALLGALSGDEAAVEIELMFGVGGDELQAHSELIDRFSSDSPVCCEALAAKTLSLSSPEVYLDGTKLACAGSIEIHVADCRWEDISAECEDAKPCMEAKRSAAGDASALSWRLRDSIRIQDSDGARAANIERCAALGRDLGRAEPQAFEWAAAHCPGADPDALGAAQAAHDKARSGIASKSRPSPARIEDFKIHRSTVESAPWRGPELAALARRRDSLGNSLAHKACAGLDSALLALALKADPGLADSPNLGGATPYKMILNLAGGASYVGLAKAMLESRPDLASAPPGSSFQSLLRSASARWMKADALGALMQAGCKASELNERGTAVWNEWLGRKPEDFADIAKAAAAAGWDVNAPDGHGNRAIHLTGKFDNALALLDLGADPTLINDAGKQGGAGLRDDQERARLEAAYLAKLHPQGRPVAKSRSI